MTSTFKPDTGEPTGGQSPILEMETTLDSYVVDETIYDEGTPQQRKAMAIVFKHKDIEVLRLREGEMYPFPTHEVRIGYTDRTKSRGGTRWEAFSSSGRKIFGGKFDLDDLVGKRQVWAQLPFKIRQGLTDEDGNPIFMMNADGEPLKDRNNNPRQEWGDVDALCWQIVSVEGQVAVGLPQANGASAADTLLDYIAGLAEGLDTAKFYQTLTADEKVRGNADVVDQITERQLVQNLISLGKITRDEEGVLHKV